MNANSPNPGMFVKRVSIVIGALSISAVLGYVYLDVQDVSPGKLSGVHAQLPELTGADNCLKCHGSGSQTMGESCLACHADIAEQLTEQTGLHGQLESALANKCWQCHSEHHGLEFQVTNRRSFELAGVTSTASFQHEGLDFQLTSIHADLACDACHHAAGTKILPVGTKRFIGLTQNCQACHEDIHLGSYGSDCASCHGQAHPFSRVAEFRHTDLFALRGSHENLDCKSCHAAESDYSVASLLDQESAGVDISKQLRTCVDCHNSPHNSGFIQFVADQWSLASANSCLVCHSAAHSSFADVDVTVTRHLHELTGFSLAAPHDQIGCAGCHGEFKHTADITNTFADRFPGRQMDDCLACHGDPHLGQFDNGTQKGKRCIDCHGRHEFLPSLFSAASHEATAFPIHGAHSELACSACHRKQSEIVGESSLQVRVFHGTTTSCAECHGDPHFGQFQLGIFGGKDCNTCHDDRSFDHPTFTQQQHALTGFPLSGGHAAVGCNQCHASLSPEQLAQIQNGGVAQLVGRQFHGVSTRCNDCHGDAHKGAFDHAQLPAATGTLTDCARCHVTESFRAIRNNEFDHGKWTDFELAGAHASASCTACHQLAVKPDPLGRTFGFAAGRNCQDCHSDPHVGQFGDIAAVNCAKCHSEETHFSKLKFDHQRDSAFPLDAQHIQLNCAACHKSYPLTNGGTAIRYKPLGTVCADCHLPRTSNRREDR